MVDSIKGSSESNSVTPSAKSQPSRAVSENEANEFLDLVQDPNETKANTETASLKQEDEKDNLEEQFKKNMVDHLIKRNQEMLNEIKKEF